MKQEERRNYMEKILFACDLDNTLIHSWRHRKSGDVCIEHIGEKEQGYMSPKAAELYRSLPENILLVPVTTRSVDQYRRIEWPGNREPELAVTTNGAILLGRKDVLRDGITGSGLRDGQGEDSGGGTVQQDSGDDLSGLRARHLNLTLADDLLLVVPTYSVKIVEDFLFRIAAQRPGGCAFDIEPAERPLALHLKNDGLVVLGAFTAKKRNRRHSLGKKIRRGGT
jgi:hypothetical protein